VRAATADELVALARKYRTLASLRRDKAQDGSMAPRSVLRALAREFPGALRELDTVPLEEIDRRVNALDCAAVERTVDGRDPDPWMTWMVAYHATMRAALLVKARVARGKLDVGDVDEVATAIAEKTGVSVDAAFVRAVASPPGGRLNRAVFDRLGVEFGAAPDELWETLFPSRHPGRYAKRSPP
jgi:hypothetical protein